MTERHAIALLAPDVIERIAAGEAIERPAAAVKELVENSLDAGATEIGVEAHEGGLALLRVIDDGAGIPGNELELACRRHATSKCRDSADLEAIQTLGFRGEALASLVAVADVNVLSAVADGGAGWQVVYSGGTLVHRGPAPRRQGTTVTMRRLFASLPARRRFLDHSSREVSRIAQVLRRYAMLNPAVRFTLSTDSRLVFRTTGSVDPRITAGECWGTAVRSGLLTLPLVEREGFRLTGWIGDRASSRSDHAGIILAVNGRPVDLAASRETIEAVYRPLFPRGRHPYLIVRIDCPPVAVDVNVHPTKADVLLRDRGNIEAGLTAAIREALQHTPEQLSGVLAVPALNQSSLPLLPDSLAATLRLSEVPRRYRASRDRDQGADVPRALSQLRLIGQLQQRLILLEGDGSLYLVDQHRAHERILYERLRREDTAASAQALVEPLVLELRPEQVERFAQRLADLAALGFYVERLEGLTFLVHSVPVVEGGAETLGAIVAEDELWRDATLPGDHWLDRLRTAVACRTAVRRGQVLPSRTIQQLLFELEQVGSPAVCPHGSPLILEVTADFLERQFDW